MFQAFPVPFRVGFKGEIPGGHEAGDFNSGGEAMPIRCPGQTDYRWRKECGGMSF